MNVTLEMQLWLQEQRESIDSQQKQLFDSMVAGEIDEQEATAKICELVWQMRFLEKVQRKVCEIEITLGNEAEDEVWSHYNEEDGEEFDLFKDEEEIVLPYPDEEEDD